MKLNETSLNTVDTEISIEDLLGEEHIGTSEDTPLRPDAFLLTDQEKIAKIEILRKFLFGRKTLMR